MFEIVDDYGKNGIHIKNCLSKEECEQILKFIELNKNNPEYDLFERNRSYIDVYAMKNFLDSYTGIFPEDNLFNLLKERTDKAAKIYLNQNKLDSSNYNFSQPESDIVYKEEGDCKNFSIKSWKIGAGLRDHVDTYSLFDKTIVSCVFSIIVYLNDDYEGGELVLMPSAVMLPKGRTAEHKRSSDITIRPSAGSMVIVDAEIVHRVEPPTSGKRMTTDRPIYLLQ
jgi:hypothetical protein